MADAALSRRDSQRYATAVHKQLFDHQYSVDSIIVTLSIALALYNSLEMILLIASTFKRWRGLYFWSLSACNAGVMLYAIGIMLGYFSLGALWIGKTILDLGWLLMISCQALVLYSRLGLIIDNPKILNGVKWMIIITSTTVLPTVIILDFGNTYSGLSTFSQAYFYIEHIQMTVITLQELIISGLYVFKTTKLLNIISATNTRSLIWQLLTINLIIIMMDVAIVVLQYKHYQLYQESIKGFVYSVKLKLELNILSKLVNLVHGNASSRQMTLEAIDSNAIAGQAQAELRQEFFAASLGAGDHEQCKSQAAVDNDETAFKEKSIDGAESHESGNMCPVLSQQTMRTHRNSHRESDILYAEAIRDLK